MKKLILGTIFSIFMLLLILVSAEAQFEKHISGDSWFGCSNKEEFSKISGYLIKKDQQAFTNAMTRGIQNGSITLFKDGETVFVEDTAIFSGLIKIRRNGETIEYWTNIEAVK